MLLTEYADTLARVIEEYSRTELITDSSVSTDLRTTKVGVVKGAVSFVDDSRLFFTEYVDCRYKPEKLTYSFHYQNKDGGLIFRYDNAAHRPDPGFRNHKHMSPECSLVQAGIPELAEILDEIVCRFL